MISALSRPAKRSWSTVSFPSTLYLMPVLDLLLAELPLKWRFEVRLGLQEALVNAAKHGNRLDPNKTVLVRFSIVSDQYWWIITDQGSGFQPPIQCTSPESVLPCNEFECGRGLYIIYQIFDQVQWSADGTELRVCKSLK